MGLHGVHIERAGFVLIGLQLPFVLAGIRGYSFRELLRDGVVFSALLILLRMVWVFPGAYLANFVRARLLHQDVGRPPVRQILVAGWAGMRGVIALAAALALPETLSDGSPFPQRNLIIFLTYCVILVTLVLQGLTLPPLIRWLGLAGAASSYRLEEEHVRRSMIEAGLAHLATARRKSGEQFASVYAELEQRYRQRLANLMGHDDRGTVIDREAQAHHLALLRNLLAEERRTAVALRDKGRINDEVLRKVEHELDLSETRLSLKS